MASCLLVQGELGSCVQYALCFFPSASQGGISFAALLYFSLYNQLHLSSIWLNYF